MPAALRKSSDFAVESLINEGLAASFQRRAPCKRKYFGDLGAFGDFRAINEKHLISSRRPADS